MRRGYTHTFNVSLTLVGGALPTTARAGSSYLMKTELIARDLGLSRAQFNRYLKKGQKKGELTIGGIKIKLWPMGTDAQGRTRWAANESCLMNPALREVLRDQRGVVASTKRKVARARTTRGANGRFTDVSGGTNRAK